MVPRRWIDPTHLTNWDKFVCTSSVILAELGLICFFQEKSFMKADFYGCSYETFLSCVFKRNAHFSRTYIHLFFSIFQYSLLYWYLYNFSQLSINFLAMWWWLTFSFFRSSFLMESKGRKLAVTTISNTRWIKWYALPSPCGQILGKNKKIRYWNFCCVPVHVYICIL